MHRQRPVNLELTTFLPLAAIVSITHRITGVVLFGGVGVLLYLLDCALASKRGLDHVHALLAMPLMKFVVLGTLAALAFHVVAGVRHLLLDFHVGDSLAGGRRSAMITIGVSIVAITGAGVWIW